MNLRQLEVFHAGMTNGTASPAAEVLRISQPVIRPRILLLPPPNRRPSRIVADCIEELMAFSSAGAGVFD